MNDKRVYFFDFDGVVLDSVGVKTAAFRKLFRPYGDEVAQRVVDYHLANGGMSRFKKFEYYYQVLLGKKISGNEMERLNVAFNNEVMASVLGADYLPGVYDYLTRLGDSSSCTVLISATPEAELIDILIRRKLVGLFDEVHGAPKEKAAVIRSCLERYEVSPQECVFFGDSINDYNAAQETNVPFVGVVQNGRLNPFSPEVIVISTF